ncbi:hypothetical protein TrLO_g8439 [Triparma laevis f. longispina]|uniref:Radial spoke protein 3 n=1 Tax=Triparma laevis f. longispina TaxID=1714387 RepID=A0A9W7E8R8_9STRA|nr:hypothetical protein TrLO_g8439 [Triparma laevis f. longispina]
MASNSAYDFSSAPVSVPVKRNAAAAKYRDDEENMLDGSNNIMFDARVVRGNTYAAQVVTQEQQRQQQVYERNENARQGRLEARRMQGMAPPGTPPPVDGRSHMDVQTENFLEELTDRPVESTVETQTEAFLDRPPSPLFVPAKNGVDVETQIEGGDLFDFDLEVGPILDVLVGKTLEVSMLELMEEEELAAIRRQQEKFEMMRNAELSEVQRLEYEAKRKFAEKQRRKKQEREFKEAQEQLKEKVAARSFARGYLGDLHANVFGELEADGVFYDPVRREVSEIFLPWLVGEVTSSLTNVAAAYSAADDIIRASLEKAKVIRAKAVDDHEAKLKAEAEAKAKAEAEALAKAEEERLRLEAEAAAEGGEE